eukprot:4082818-Pleurochrysis_carterae.AAC.4
MSLLEYMQMSSCKISVVTLYARRSHSSARCEPESTNDELCSPQAKCPTHCQSHLEFTHRKLNSGISSISTG